MRKLVVESVQEFRNLRALTEEQINENIFNSLKGNVDKFLANPQDVDLANKLIVNAFAKQFSGKPKTKEAILKLPLEKKVAILKMVADKMKDPKVGILKLAKNAEGKLVVGGMAVSGGATQSAAGA
jgi:hypothetical protein